MEVLIKNMSEILSDRISVYQRGLLVTILILKEENSKMTLAKLKASINMKAAKKDLMFLHRHKLIKWSGYQNAEKSLERLKVSPDIHEVISFMNDLYKRKFNPDSESTISSLRNRLETYDVETIKRVVANRWTEWKDDPLMSKHLNPTTIFRPSKFDKYLEDVNSTRKGDRLVNAEKVNLRHGDELKKEHLSTFISSEIYSIKEYEIDREGVVRGSGISRNLYGNTIKILLERQIKKGTKREYKFIYQNN